MTVTEKHKIITEFWESINKQADKWHKSEIERIRRNKEIEQ